MIHLQPASWTPQPGEAPPRATDATDPVALTSDQRIAIGIEFARQYAQRLRLASVDESRRPSHQARADEALAIVSLVVRSPDDFWRIIRHAVENDAKTVATKREIDSAPAQCLAHLLSSQVEHRSKGQRLTVRRLIQEGLVRDHAGEQARETLRSYGLGLEIGAQRDTATTPFLLVAHRHDALRNIFAATPWDFGGWGDALGRLAGAFERQTPVWFTGIKVRATEVPGAYLLIDAKAAADRQAASCG